MLALNTDIFATVVRLMFPRHKSSDAQWVMRFSHFIADFGIEFEIVTDGGSEVLKVVNHIKRVSIDEVLSKDLGLLDADCQTKVILGC